MALRYNIEPNYRQLSNAMNTYMTASDENEGILWETFRYKSSLQNKNNYTTMLKEN